MIDFIVNNGFNVMVGFITFCISFVIVASAITDQTDMRYFRDVKRPYFSELLKESKKS